MTEMLELFTGENGKHIMVGFMVGASAGYAFATKTALAVAKETIQKKEQEIQELRSQVEKYVGQLIDKG